MGRYLRPRRGYKNAAVSEDILLLNGEIFLEFPEGRGIGKTPGKIIIGDGESKYSEKVDNSNDPNDFQAFITDPQIYVPIFIDSEPASNYKYHDEDRGTTLLNTISSGSKTLPELIGIVKRILCEHTDNLKYDNYRIEQLESQQLIGVRDIKVCYIEIVVDYIPWTEAINVIADNIPEGYTFLKWDSVVSIDGANQSYIENIESNPARLRSYSAFRYDDAYRCYYLAIKKN